MLNTRGINLRGGIGIEITVIKVVGGTLAAVGMVNVLVHYDEKPHPHQEGPPDRPAMELTRPRYEVGSNAAVTPPGRQLMVSARDADYFVAHHIAQVNAQMMMMRSNAKLVTSLGL